MTRSIRHVGVLVTVLSLALHGGLVRANQTVGPTYPIAEPDMLEEIHDRAGAVDWKKKYQDMAKKPSAVMGAFLPDAKENQVRIFDPTYTLPKDIVNGQGVVIYPAGYRVNPLRQLIKPSTRRYIVVGPDQKQLAWLTKIAKPTAQDMVLLARGNVLEQRENGREVYQLDQRFIERFGVRAVPAIVTRAGEMWRVEEYAVP